MKRGSWGGLMVAAVLIFVAATAAQADRFDTLQEICDAPAAHDYCKEQGGCHLIGEQHLGNFNMSKQLEVLMAYEAGIAEGKRQAEEAAKSTK